MTFEPRDEDDLSSHSNLTWQPPRNKPFRWLPRQGRPLWKAEWWSQTIIKCLAWLPMYTAITVTAVLLILVLQIFGVPF